MWPAVVFGLAGKAVLISCVEIFVSILVNVQATRSSVLHEPGFCQVRANKMFVVCVTSRVDVH